MLKEIAALWQDGGIMKEAVRALSQMLADAEYVYVHAWEVCTGQAVIAKTEKPLKKHDKAVNRGEREIRRMLVQHLSINPGQDTSGCLAIMNMAKDAERVGDHARNIFDLGVRLEGKMQDLQFFERLDAIRRPIGKFFPELQRAILDSNEELAREILLRYGEVKKKIKPLKNDLFEAELSTREAVATAFLLRYVKRINAHIGNIASGIIFPLEYIDFVSRGLKQEEKDR